MILKYKLWDYLESEMLELDVAGLATELRYRNKEDYELMPAIGVKDAYGKELYLDDIVECIFFDYKYMERRHERCRIVWNERSSRLDVELLSKDEQYPLSSVSFLVFVGNYYEERCNNE